MIPKRSPRILAALLLALATAMMAGPAITVAATPNWTGELEALPPVVKLGAVAGYRATITNPGPSNVSQLFVSAVFSQPYDPDALTSSGHPPVFVKLAKNGVELIDACGDDPLNDEPLSCNLGALTAGSTAVLVVAYQTSGMSDAGVTVRWTTTGLGSGDDDASHGDVLKQTFDNDPLTDAPPPTLISNDANFDGGFTEEPDEFFATSGPFSASNLFTTSFTTEDAFIPVMVQDDTTAAFAPCPAGESCYGAPTQDAILLSINEGTPFGALTPITIKVLKDAVPKGSNVNRVVVVHYFDEGSFDPATEPAFEEIGNDCPKTGIPTATCRTVSWDGRNGIYTIVVWLTENGVVKFH